MTGDVTLSKDNTTVVVTATDQILEPNAINEYLTDGYIVVKDEREDCEEN